MNLKDRVKIYERQAVFLEKVASHYAEGLHEHEAIRQAAIALWYALTQQKGDFLTYLENWNKDLTPEQEVHLRSMGIDPDAPDAEWDPLHPPRARRLLTASSRHALHGAWQPKV